MKIHYWKSTQPNFGDDLNLWFWPELLGDSIGFDDGVLLVGIGSVIGNELPEAERYIVLGAGAAYSALPNGFGGPQWSIYGVRGPLTAAMCGLDDGKILADPAILLPQLLTSTGPKDEKVRFVPHYHSAIRAPWDRICTKAEIELLDPREDSKSVISKIAASRLVLAESMHAAIIADAYRVPWIPVWSTREISSFKWHDWALAVGAKVEPRFIPAPSPLAWLDNLAAPFVANDNTLFPNLDTSGPERAIARAVVELNSELKNRRGYWPTFRRRNYLRIRKRVAEPLLAAIGNGWAARQENQTAERLSEIAQSNGFLSDEELFRSAVGRLTAAVEKMKKDQGSSAVLAGSN